ncbi:MAG: DUF3868 domain-containing protein [Odoribacter sp.]
MKNNLLYFIIGWGVLLFGGITAVQAQTVFNGLIQIANRSIEKSTGGQLMIAMDIILQENLKISSNRNATLTPVLRRGENGKELPAVIIYGRKREIISRRQNMVPVNIFQALRRKRKTEQIIDYRVQVAYEKWMETADLFLIQDLCGCGGNREESSEDSLVQLDFRPQEHYQVKPLPSFVQPLAENVKHRSVSGQAFLDFPVNQIIIYPEYRKNPVELATIRSTIDIVIKDTCTEITGVTIHGYASPEGKYSNNIRLAQGRSEALKEYVNRLYRFKNKVFTVLSTPEDWEGLKNRVQTSTLKDKTRILSIIEGNDTPDIKEQKLKALGESYRYMLNEWFPALRHSDYAVKYVVRDFNAEQAREIIQTRPQLLSLREMYAAAQLCERGSEEYNHIFETAVKMFPADPWANLNAAAMEIMRGNKEKAKEYLMKTDQNLPVVQNNLAAIALLEGECEQAEQYLSRATGIAEADHNRQELIKKRENNKLFE